MPIKKKIIHRQQIIPQNTQNSNFRAAVEEQVRIENEVKILIGGVSPGLIHFYCDFAKKVVSLRKKYKGLTLLNEIEIFQKKWYGRGLVGENPGQDKNLLCACLHSRKNI